METTANEAGYNLLISQSLESAAREQANALTMFNSRVDGLIVSVAYDTDSADHFACFLDKGIPLLFFDRVLPGDRSTCLVIDNEQAGYDATRHLMAQGCQRILHVTGSLRRNVYADRLAGYRRALASENRPADDALVLVTDLGQEAGQQAAAYLLDQNPRPDGLFMANDFGAATAIGALKRAGLSVPGDVRVVGFNDDPIAQVVEPNLTTVRYPGGPMGALAARTLIDQLDGRIIPPDSRLLTLPTELIVRASTGPHAPGLL